jgi:hypothetical protein
MDFHDPKGVVVRLKLLLGKPCKSKASRDLQALGVGLLVVN